MFFHDNVCALSEAKGMKTYMIINKEAYDWLFPTINTNDILINTWFLSRESVGVFKCENLDYKLILKIIETLNNGINKLTELSSVTENKGVQEYRLLYSSNNQNNKMDMTQLIINDSNLKTVTAIVDFPLKVLGRDGVAKDYFVNNSTEILFSLNSNIIEITVDYSSILVQNNTLLLTAIYLFDLGLIKHGNESELNELQKFLNKNTKLSDIINILKKQNGLTISDQEYQYVENCSMVIEDNKFEYFDNNFNLFSINKTQFERFIKKISQIVEMDFQYRKHGYFSKISS